MFEIEKMKNKILNIEAKNENFLKELNNKDQMILILENSINLKNEMILELNDRDVKTQDLKLENAEVLLINTPNPMPQYYTYTRS